MFLKCPLTLYLPLPVPPADRPPLMAVTPGVEDGRVYFICSGPIGGLFVFLQSGVGRSGTIPLFIPLSVNAAHIPGVSPASPLRKLRHTCSGGLECRPKATWWCLTLNHTTKERCFRAQVLSLSCGIEEPQLQKMSKLTKIWVNQYKHHHHHCDNNISGVSWIERVPHHCRSAASSYWMTSKSANQCGNILWLSFNYLSSFFPPTTLTGVSMHNPF